MSAVDNHLCLEAVQAFFDDVTSHKMNQKYVDWYQVDVAAVLSGCNVEGHDVDQASGDSLVFLKSSLMFCSPELGVMRHYPRSLVHCFVEDNRRNPESPKSNPLFRGELFSVTPESEQLCWVKDCENPENLPSFQSTIATWMKWLNKA